MVNWVSLAYNIFSLIAALIIGLEFGVCFLGVTDLPIQCWFFSFLLSGLILITYLIHADYSQQGNHFYLFIFIVWFVVSLDKVDPLGVTDSIYLSF